MSGSPTDLAGRLESVRGFINKKAVNFHRTLSARERANYDVNDIVAELQVAIIEQDHGFDPNIAKYTTYITAIVSHRLAYIKDHANTVESPPNANGRSKEYQEEEDNNTISKRRRKTADDIRRTRYGIVSIDRHHDESEGSMDRADAPDGMAIAVECPPDVGAMKAEDHKEAIKTIIDAVKTLKPIEAWLLGATYGLWGQQRVTIGELAARSGRSPDKLSRIKSNAIAKLRTQFSESTQIYLDLLGE
jgi:DNA-directed RNA polymerase specialized sigma subunit